MSTIIDTLRTDLRSTLRGLQKSRLYAIAAVSSLALSIAATVATFVLIEGLVLHSAPWQRPDEIFLLQRVDQKTGEVRSTWSTPRFDDVRRATAGAIADVASFATRGVTLAAPAGDSGIRADAEFVSPGYLRLAGVAPIRGRAFDASPSAGEGTVLLSARVERSLFPNGDAIGKTLRVNGVSLTIIGTMPESFLGLSGRGELWVPLASAPAVWAQLQALSQYSWAFTIALRVPRGWTNAQRRGVLDNLDRAIGTGSAMVASGGGGSARAAASSRLALASANDALKEPGLTSLLWILLGAAVCVLVLACANVASLSVARLTTRQTELAVRSALGATAFRLAASILTEATVIAGASAVLGFLAAVWAKTVLWGLRPTSGSAAAKQLAVALAPAVGARTIGFTLGVTVMAVVLIALWPVLEVRRPLGARRVSFGAGDRGARMANPRTGRLRAALSTFQLGLAFVVTMSAVLFVVSLRTMTRVDHGFSPSGVLTLRLDLPRTRYDAARAGELYSSLLSRMALVPGVINADISNSLPLDVANEGTAAAIDLALPIGKGGRGTHLEYHAVGPAYFRALGVGAGGSPLSLVASNDRGGDAVPVLITRAAAAQFWPGRNPVGQSVHEFLLAGLSGQWKRGEIVGIAPDIQYGAPGAPAEPGIYVSYADDPPPHAILVVKTRGEPLDLVAPIRAVLRTLDPQLVLFATRTMDERVREVSAATRFGSIVLAAYAGVALVIALIGVYSVIAFGVAQRRLEIGIRMAIGATPQGILSSVLSRGLVVTAAGIGLGLAATVAAQRLIASHLFGIAATDPRSLVFVLTVFSVAGVCASVLPAVSATRVDPASALRSES